MKRYIVTEEQLAELVALITKLDNIEIPNWAMHFAADPLLPGNGENEVMRIEEIPK